MNSPPINQPLTKIIAAFITDRQAARLSPETIKKQYQRWLTRFAEFAASHDVLAIGAVDADLIRRWLLALEARGHNPGGVHQAFRGLRAFLRWFEREYEPADWRNPIRKVKPPKLNTEPIVPIAVETISAMLATCDSDELGLRDRAMLMALLDTGARAAEFLALDVADVNPVSGAVGIKRGKGGKPRSVFLGERSRRALRAWLRERDSPDGPLWAKHNGERLTYAGLRQMLRRRAIAAGVPTPPIHDFRRAFALNSLRAGMDVYSLQKLMGHADLQILRRYLAQTDEDLRAAHTQYSPVDRAKLTH
jgi:site-specific recombinase XerD